MLRKTLLLAVFLAGSAHAQSIEVTANGPAGRLEGTLETAPNATAAALILAGSGPTDRNGNSPLGLAANSYQMLSAELASRGISTLRADKRGIGGSQGDPNDVVLAEFSADAEAWIDVLRANTGFDCVWLVGHSEGALVASLTADNDGVCGLVLLTPPGRNVGDLFREQVATQPLIAASADAFDVALDVFAQGQMPDLSSLHPGLHGIFDPLIARYMRDLIATDPAALLAGTTLPVLIIHGDGDVQAPPEEAAPLLAARPDAEAHVLSGMTHVLKQALARSEAPSHEAYTEASLATYSNPAAPLQPELAPLIARFITGDAMAEVAPVSDAPLPVQPTQPGFTPVAPQPGK